MYKNFLDKLVEHGNGQLVEVLILINQSDKTDSVLFVRFIDVYKRQIWEYRRLTNTVKVVSLSGMTAYRAHFRSPSCLLYTSHAIPANLHPVIFRSLPCGEGVCHHKAGCGQIGRAHV